MERRRRRTSNAFQESQRDASTLRQAQGEATVTSTETFDKAYQKIGHAGVQAHIDTLRDKIVINPLIGKPMRHNRKGTREVYVSPFRLSYIFDEASNTIIFLDIYHKDRQ